MSASRSRSDDYVRFVVLGEPRTGSTMLAQALNSHSAIMSFREIFNWRQDFVDFQMPGYDRSSDEDLAWRKRDPVGFLRERIFCRRPAEIGAVGFKFLHPHFWGFPGLVPHLAANEGLRVLHVRRRNALRQLVSRKIAENTGVWVQGNGALGRTMPRFLRASRHPLRAMAGLRRRLRRQGCPEQIRRAPITISPEMCTRFVDEIALRAAHVNKVFREHPMLTVYYEDMVARSQDVFGRAQEFLDVELQPLTVATRRQNPEPLRELIENYDELRRAFKGTPQERFFE